MKLFNETTVDHIVAPIGAIVKRLERHVEAMRDSAGEHRRQADESKLRALRAECEMERARAVMANISKLLS